MILCTDCVSLEIQVLVISPNVGGNLPGWVSQDISAVERKDAGPRLELTLGAGKQGVPAGR